NKAILLKQGRLFSSGPTAEVARTYLSGADAHPQTVWSGVDGDEELALLEVAAVGGSSDGVVHTDQHIRIQVKFRAGKPLLCVVCAVEVHSRGGGRLVYSAIDDVQPPPAQAIPAGAHGWELTIPANTFSAGDYRIDVDLGIHNVRRVSTGLSGLLL